MRAVWFTTQGWSIGIVIVIDQVTKVEKACIGWGKGENETQDMESIVKWGAHFPIEIAKQLF